jgi:hypothetical protein
MADDRLPAQLPPGSANGDAAYYRRRIDELVDRRLIGIEDSMRNLDDRADKHDQKLNWIFGGLAVVSVVANLLAPTVIRWLSGQP